MQKQLRTCSSDGMHAVGWGAGQRSCRPCLGEDRIAANGDVANKIGTYGLAVLAKAHRIPFYVAAPQSTFDPTLAVGELIPIERRSADELEAAPGADVFNPAFDVTPAELVTAIVTDRGILRPPYAEAIKKLFD